MQRLSPSQQRVYDYIRATIASGQPPPTRAEIAVALGFASANAAQSHLRTLARKGAIDLDARHSRGIRLTGPDSGSPGATAANARSRHDPSSLAVIGRVAAGAPLLAVEHVERYCRLDPGLFSARPDYGLRVHGDSMTGAGIFDGDVLAVRRTETIRTGQIAVFRWDDEVTVKRYARAGPRVRLLAENPAYRDIWVDTRRETLTVEGLAVGVIRAL